MNTTTTAAIGTTGRGRGWAYLGALLGGVVSIAANVAHSYVPPTSVMETGPAAVEVWRPHLGAVVGAVFWPVALFIAVEIFARITWPQLHRWTALRFLGLLPVALVAAIVSYRHLSGLLTFYGEDTLTTIIGPLAVDGLMVMASGALVATSNRNTTTMAVPASAPAGPVDSGSGPGPDVPAASEHSSGQNTAFGDQDGQDGRPVPDPTRSEDQDGAGLLDLARAAASAHLAEHGRPITRDQLRAQLRTSTDTATAETTPTSTPSDIDSCGPSPNASNGAPNATQHFRAQRFLTWVSGRVGGVIV
jgi:hypothetical protein